MKREFLEGLDLGLGEDVKLSKNAIDAIMEENGRDIEAKNNTITALTTERDGLKTQLGDANATIQSYKDMDIDGIKKSAADWQTKYNTETKALQDKLDAQAYGYAVEGIVAKEKFSSQAAKKAFVSELTSKGLKLEDGKLLGYDEFLKGYKESDPDAFAPDDTNGTPPPTVVSATRGGSGGAMSAMRAAFGLPDKKE